MKAMPVWGRLLVFALLLAAYEAPVQAQGTRRKQLAERGEKLFTKFSLFYEKDHHITTNYRKGILVPINTEVEFVKASKGRITVRIQEYNLNLNIENEEDYSGEKIDGIFERTFGREATDLSGFSESEQKMIKKGTVAAGMSKAAVVKAMGYPPRHKTPSLKLDQWRYWQNRFDTILVVFAEDKVVEIRD